MAASSSSLATACLSQRSSEAMQAQPTPDPPTHPTFLCLAPDLKLPDQVTCSPNERMKILGTAAPGNPTSRISDSGRRHTIAFFSSGWLPRLSNRQAALGSNSASSQSCWRHVNS
eukprot:scaffold162219_cov33-Tisochrysis_lutea.AAC.2